MKCNNIRSRHYPNERCKNRAIHDKDYCAKHLKNPKRFLDNSSSIEKIQNCWRNYSSINNYKRQGPARNILSISNNSTELYSLEPLESIPKIYIFSFWDTNKNIWCFDIRTLSFLLSKSKLFKNPYTRDIVSKEIIKKIEIRLSWLQSKKYEIMYIDNTSFSHEQIWNQKVLDIFSKMEELGYLVEPEWFHEMDREDHINFYKKLYNLWNFRLNLTEQEKRLIVPSYQSSKHKLFKISSYEELVSKEENCLKKQNLQIIERFVSSGFDKPQKSLGCMYILMGLSYINESVLTTYPWINDTLF